MLVIVEGIDRVGKGILCRNIQDRLKFPIIKDMNFGGIKYNKLVQAEKMHTMLNMISTINPLQDLIVDRMYMSELIYGKARGYENEYMQNILEMLVLLRARLILVQPTDLLKSSKEHGNDLNADYHEFCKLYSDCPLHKTECNYNSRFRAVEWVQDELALEMRYEKCT